MAYATSDDLVERFGEEQLKLIADRDNDGELDQGVLDQAIAAAGGIVDLALRGIYALPLTPVPTVIVDIVADLARTGLYGKATEVPESVANRDKAARDLLKQIAAGTFKLDAAVATVADAGAAAAEIELVSEEPFFNATRLKGF